MNYKQFPQLPKELLKSDIGIVIFELTILEDNNEMCSHDVDNLLFLVGASDAFPLSHAFFNFEITSRNQ